MRSRGVRRFLPVALAVLAALSVWLSRYAWNRAVLDQSLSIHLANLTDWDAYGGSWEVNNAVIHNDSDERGAKLMTGSPEWKDYTLRTDLKFDGERGDMGVVVRSNHEEEGVDSYNGYYIGLRTTDGTLVAGRSDYGWMEAQPVLMPGGVHSSAWYRLTVVAVGCNIAAESENLSTSQKTWIALSEIPCVRTGRIGLRSLATGGSWRNFSVRPATNADFLALSRRAPGIERPELPKEEASYNRSFRFSPSYPSSALSPSLNTAAGALPAGARSRIGDLLEMPRTGRTSVIVRGIVTLTSPKLYVQDASGGALVQAVSAPRLNVGDAVEVAGLAQPSLYSSVIDAASVRELWTGTPVPPISITALQAALGNYDRRFVEMEGELKGLERDRDGRQFLDLEDRGQPFKAVYAGMGRSAERLPRVGSYLRIRGICVLDEQYTRGTAPFALLLRSEDDVHELAGPPWWTAAHIGLLFAGALFLGLGVQIGYFRIQRWKTLVITQERERLAHDIHDTMAQSFAGVGYQIQGIRSSVKRGDYRDSQQIADQLSVAYHLVRRCHEEASQTIAMLGRSGVDQKQDLLQVLEQTANRISQGQVTALTAVRGVPSPISLRVTNALLHIGQEAITNALRHANPQTLRIQLSFQKDSVRLVIQDDGSGFDVAPARAGFGILGMEKRARDIHAQFVLNSVPERGTTVIVTAARRPSSFRTSLVLGLERMFMRS